MTDQDPEKHEERRYQDGDELLFGETLYPVEE